MRFPVLHYFVLCPYDHQRKIKASLKNINLGSVWPLLDDGICKLLKLLFWGGGLVAVRREHLLFWKLTLLGCNAMLNHNLAFPSLHAYLPVALLLTISEITFTSLVLTHPFYPNSHHFSIPVAHLNVSVSFTCGPTSCFNTTIPIGLLTQMYSPA
jgi:hypothetical protein